MGIFRPEGEPKDGSFGCLAIIWVLLVVMLGGCDKGSAPWGAVLVIGGIVIGWILYVYLKDKKKGN